MEDSLSCDTVLAHYIIVFYLILYFYTCHTYLAPLLRFSHILLYTIFFIYLTPRGIFLSFLIRPHSTNILLSNVSSFVDTMEFTMKHKRVNLLQFINRVSSHVFVEVARYNFSVATSFIFESLILKQFDLYGKTITHVLHLE